MPDKGDTKKPFSQESDLNPQSKGETFSTFQDEETSSSDTEKTLSKKTSRDAEEARVREANRLARTVRAQDPSQATQKGSFRRKEHPTRRLNLPFAIGLVVFMVLIGGGVPLLHGIQTDLISSRSLDRGREAEEAGNLNEAIRYYGYYLRYEPEDFETQGKLALLAAERAKRNPHNQRLLTSAYQLLDRSIVHLPDNLDIIRDLADFSFKLGRYSSAVEHYQRLVKAFPENSDMQVKLGKSYMATEHTSDAIRIFLGVNATDKKNLDAYVELAEVYYNPIVDNPEAADALMTVMITENPSSHKAFLARSDFRFRHNQLDQAHEDIESAKTIAPNAVEVHLMAAQHARKQSKIKEAQKHLDIAKDLAPDNSEVKDESAELGIAKGELDDAEIWIKEDDPNNPSSRVKLIHIHLKQGDLEAARGDIREMRKAGFRPEVIEYFEIRILLDEENWQVGTKRLERLRVNVASWPEFRNQVDLLLGACYEKLHLVDRQLETYQNIIIDDPDSLPAGMGLASALFQTGKLDKAYERYQKLIEQMGEDEFLKVPGLRDNLFQLIIARTEQLPEEQRDWTELEEYIGKLSKVEGIDSIQHVLMQAELFSKKEQYQEAQDLIRTQCNEHPTQAGLWVALAKLVAMDKGPEEGLKTLEQVGKKHVTSKLLIQMTQANLASRLDVEEASLVLQQLGEEGINELDEGQKPRLWLGLGAAYYRLRNRVKAKQYWNLAAKANPKNLRIRMTLFELAREAGQKKDMEAIVDEIRRLTGVQSAEALYCDASMRVWGVKTGRNDKSSLANIDQDLEKAKNLRPSWHEIPRLKGEIALIQGNVDDASKYFERAAELGPLSPVYLSQLVRLLYAKGRWDQAHEVMSRMEESGQSTWNKLGIELDYRTGRLDVAIEKAGEIVKDSNIANDHLWYGQMLARDGQFDKAEQEVRKALEIDSNLPEAWIGLVRLLVQQDKRKEAENEISLAQTRLPVDRAPIVLADSYVIIGDTVRAEKHYLNAVRFAPENLSVIRAVARFYLRLGQSKQSQAKKYLEQLFVMAERDPKKYEEVLVWTRRNLARVLASGGDYPTLQRAMKLLSQTDDENNISIDDLRLKALLLAKRPEAISRKEAIILLETLRDNSNVDLTPNEMFTLGQLYENVGRWISTQETLSMLIRENPRNASYYSNFVYLMLKNDSSISDIRPYLKKLENLQPNDPKTVSLKVRVLAKEGKVAEAVDLAKTLVPRPLQDDKMMKLRNAASLLEEIDQIDEARIMLEEFGEKVPGGNVILGVFLGRNGTLDEALDTVSKAEGQVPAVSLLPAAISILQDQCDKTKPIHFERVKTWFDQALERNPNSKKLQLQWATFLGLREEYDRVIEIYRRFLKRNDLIDHEKAIVWNNLAFYLAADGKDPKEAIAYSNQAIEILGPIPDLLDTRGIASLASKNPQKAIEDFRLAISAEPSGIIYFHRALAYKALGNFPNAIRSLELARKNHNLVEKDIPKIERQKYRSLLVALKMEPNEVPDDLPEETKPLSLPGLSDLTEETP